MFGMHYATEYAYVCRYVYAYNLLYKIHIWLLSKLFSEISQYFILPIRNYVTSCRRLYQFYVHTVKMWRTCIQRKFINLWLATATDWYWWWWYLHITIILDCLVSCAYELLNFMFSDNLSLTITNWKPKCLYSE